MDRRPPPRRAAGAPRSGWLNPLARSSAALVCVALISQGCAGAAGGTPGEAPGPAGAPPTPDRAEAPVRAPADAPPDTAVRHEILETVRRLFRGMALKDSDLLRSALLPDAHVRPVPDLHGPEAPLSGEAFVEQVLATPDDYLERMFDPVVRLDGPMGHVWAPYDFWRNGEFSHCGTDSFDLVRTPDGWRITAITYTLHPEELCPERPPPPGAVPTGSGGAGPPGTGGAEQPGSGGGGDPEASGPP